MARTTTVSTVCWVELYLVLCENNLFVCPAHVRTYTCLSLQIQPLSKGSDPLPLGNVYAQKSTKPTPVLRVRLPAGCNGGMCAGDGRCLVWECEVLLCCSPEVL